MELFTEKGNGWKSPTVFTKSSTLDAWQGFEYATEYWDDVIGFRFSEAFDKWLPIALYVVRFIFLLQIYKNWFSNLLVLRL